jgi:hypothetical protein
VHLVVQLELTHEEERNDERWTSTTRST